jgi:HlyD family secretion protein
MNEYAAPESQTTGNPSQVVQFRAPPARAKNGRTYTRYWVGGALLVLAAFAGVGAAWRSLGSNGATRYTTVPVSRGPITRAVTATGTINPELTIIVGSYVSGVIKELFCDYNTQVKKDQVCAKIDPRPYQTVVNQAKANLATAKAQILKDEANLEYLKLNYERNLRLVQTHAVSQDVADNAKSDYEQGRAQIAVDQATIEQREAQLDAAQVNLDYTDITSPVDGTVVSRNVTVGQTVAASFQTPTLFLIASDLKEMQLDTNVSESDIGDLKEGNPATFTVDAFPKRTFVGKVSQVRQSPQTVQNIVTFDVVVSIDNSDLALMPGMTAATRIIVDQRSNAMRIPNQAVRFVPSGLTTGTPAIRGAAPAPSSNTQAQVWALREGIPVAVPVKIGLDDESFIEIVGGNLKLDDEVIVAEQRQALGRALPRPRL